MALFNPPTIVSRTTASTIIVSAIAPTNPQMGTKWLEVDSNNNLIESWHWFGFWRSETKSWVNDAKIATESIFNFYKPLLPEYDYFLKYCLFTVNTSTQLTSSNFLRLTLYGQNGNSTTSSSVTQSCENQASNTVTNYKLNWNYLFSSSATSKGLRINVNRGGVANAVLTTEYFYETIRK